MKHFVPESMLNDPEKEGEELGRMLNGLFDDQEHELTIILATVVLTVVMGIILLGIGVSLSIFWEV